MSWLLSLIGFAGRDEQANNPPLLAYLIAVPIGYFGAELIEVSTFFVQWASFGYVTRWGASVFFRTWGILGGLVLFHAMYRAVVHRDDNSWGGFLRKRIVRP